MFFLTDHLLLHEIVNYYDVCSKVFVHRGVESGKAQVTVLTVKSQSNSPYAY